MSPTLLVTIRCPRCAGGRFVCQHGLSWRSVGRLAPRTDFPTPCATCGGEGLVTEPRAAG